MRKLFLSYLVLGIASIAIFLMPYKSYASQIIFKVVPNNVPSDKATIVEVRIDPESKVLNVVEGVIRFEGLDGLFIDIENGGSVLTLWPTPPEYLPKEKAISFTGGVPKGFDQEGLLFRMRLSSSVSSDVQILWGGGSAFINDGEGTLDAISARSITLHLEKQDPSMINRTSIDNIPPSFDKPEIGRDPSVYEGKYFISFHATDELSGIERYEVVEKNTVTNITEGVYVFQDQNRRTPTLITAYDKAGNTTTIEIPARFNVIKNVIILLLIIILFVGIGYVYKKRIKK